VSADAPTAAPRREAAPSPGTRSVARNTAIFSIATGLSRIAGLIREVVARSYFGTSGPASAFTLAFQVPNLVRGLFADAALSAAFVPVFTELLEKDRKKEATQLASTLLFCILAVLGAITALAIVFAGVIMPLFTGSEFDQKLVDLTIGLSRVLFPIVVLLGVNGLVVGMLNAYGHFSIPAISPLVWNAVIIVALVALRPVFHGQNQLYAYAIGVLIGTILQLAMALPLLGRIDVRLRLNTDWRNPLVKRVFTLMLPVTIALGIINFDLVINSTIGTLISDQAPSAIDAAFRIYMLPQGMFSVAVATVLFPTLSRFAARADLDGLRAAAANGTRQIYLMLVPAAVFTAVLATPITRLIYQRGDFDTESTHLVSTALFWFSFSLPFAGVNLLLTRSFFSLQRPWIPTALSAVNLVINAIVSLALYSSVGVGGPVIGTAVASLGMMVLQSIWLARLLHGDLQTPQTLAALARIAAASAALGASAYATWWAITHVLGRSLPAEVLSVGLAAAVGFAVYAVGVLAMDIAEAWQIERLATRRLRRRRREHRRAEADRRLGDPEWAAEREARRRAREQARAQRGRTLE
jgi:putative peptidoglycan lipid II flippase